MITELVTAKMYKRLATYVNVLLELCKSIHIGAPVGLSVQGVVN